MKSILLFIILCTAVPSTSNAQFSHSVTDSTTLATRARSALVGAIEHHEELRDITTKMQGAQCLQPGAQGIAELLLSLEMILLVKKFAKDMTRDLGEIIFVTELIIVVNEDVYQEIKDVLSKYSSSCRKQNIKGSPLS
jgi:hypothetical protein